MDVNDRTEELRTCSCGEPMAFNANGYAVCLTCDSALVIEVDQ